jgi:hypothetical protein
MVTIYNKQIWLKLVQPQLFLLGFKEIQLTEPMVNNHGIETLHIWKKEKSNEQIRLVKIPDERHLEFSFWYIQRTEILAEKDPIYIKGENWPFAISQLVNQGIDNHRKYWYSGFQLHSLEMKTGGVIIFKFTFPFSSASDFCYRADFNFDKLKRQEPKLFQIFDQISYGESESDLRPTNLFLKIPQMVKEGFLIQHDSSHYTVNYPIIFRNKLFTYSDGLIKSPHRFFKDPRTTDPNLDQFPQISSMYNYLSIAYSYWQRNEPVNCMLKDL